MYASRRCFGEYNSLDDYYLQGYFTNRQLRKQLIKAGLMNKGGAPIPDALYRINVIKSDRRRRTKEELTKCLVAESINLQRQYENEIKSRLDEISKLERVRKLRLETRPISQRAHTKVRKKDLKFYLTALDKKELIRPHTVFECQQHGHADKIQVDGEVTVHPSHHIRTLMTMQFMGDDKDLSEKEGSLGEREIYVEQMIYRQKPLWVYLGKHKALEFFKFNTYRHPTFPFCLNLYINGMLHLRIHTCCEYKFAVGTRLGGSEGKFVLLDVQGYTTCGRCQCEHNMSVIPRLGTRYMHHCGMQHEISSATTPGYVCHKTGTLPREETTVSFEHTCHDCMHLEGNSPGVCKCACVQLTPTSEETPTTLVRDTCSEQAESSENECIHVESQQPAKCQCQCHCQSQSLSLSQSLSPETYVNTEESSSPQHQQCTCMQKAHNKGKQKCCTFQVLSSDNSPSTFQIEVNNDTAVTEEGTSSPPETCKKCSCNKDNFYNIEVYDGTSSAVDSEEYTARCCKGKQIIPTQQQNPSMQVIDLTTSSEDIVPSFQIITGTQTKQSVEICTECSSSYGSEIKEDSESEKESQSEVISDKLITGKIEYGEYMLEIKKNTSSCHSSCKTNCSDKASHGSSICKGYSTCDEIIIETDQEESKNICSTCSQLKTPKTEGEAKVVHIVEKPIQMNITIEGYRKKPAPHETSDKGCKSDSMHITVCCDDSKAELELENEETYDAITQTSSKSVEKENQTEPAKGQKIATETIKHPEKDSQKAPHEAEAEPAKKYNEAEPPTEENKAAEPAEAEELPVGVEHSRETENPIQIKSDKTCEPSSVKSPSPAEPSPPVKPPPPVKSPQPVEPPPPVKSPQPIELPPPVKSPAPIEPSPPSVEPSSPVKSPPHVEPSSPVTSPSVKHSATVQFALPVEPSSPAESPHPPILVESQKTERPMSDTTTEPSEENLFQPSPSVAKKKDAGIDAIAKVNACTQVHSDTFKYDKSTETTFDSLQEEDSLTIITNYENSVLWRKSSLFPSQ